jgi:hypothetical protein
MGTKSNDVVVEIPRPFGIGMRRVIVKTPEGYEAIVSKEKNVLPASADITISFQRVEAPNVTSEMVNGHAGFGIKVRITKAE